jgi:hypothetical protein
MSSLLQLVNEVLRRTGQVEISTLANAQTPAIQTRDFLNETYFEMLQKLKAQRLLKQANLTTSNGTAAYSLAGDAEINSLLGNSLLETGTQQQLWETDYTYPLLRGVTVTGKPECFYRSGNQLYFYPIPNGTYTIQYDYLLKPTNLNSDGDTTLLPVEWEKVLILGTQARLEKFLGDSGQDTYLLYQDNMSQLRKRAALKPQFRMKGFYRGST